MNVHRDLRITRRVGVDLAHRVRENWSDPVELYPGPVEADETFIGGRTRLPQSAGKPRCRGTASTAVVGIKDRRTNKVKANVVRNTDAHTLHGFIGRNVKPSVGVYTSEARAYGEL